MAFDLARIKRELQGALIASPYSATLSVAVVSDTFRLARVVPPSKATWDTWRTQDRKKKPPKPPLDEQLGMLAHLLLASSLREQTVAALSTRPIEPVAALPAFFEAIAPLTAEMIRANTFRQEEFLRRFVEAVQGDIEGESAKQSQKKLDQLDYRKTLAEYSRADAARKLEADRRKKALEAAKAAEAAARGWQE